VKVDGVESSPIRGHRQSPQARATRRHRDGYRASHGSPGTKERKRVGYFIYTMDSHPSYEKWGYSLSVATDPARVAARLLVTRPDQGTPA